MDTFVTILFLSLVLGLLFGSWSDWFKSESEREYERNEVGWFLDKLGNIISWIFLLYIIYIVFIVIKTLWRLS